MLFIGCPYHVKSEIRLCDEICCNMAYRRLCGQAASFAFHNPQRRTSARRGSRLTSTRRSGMSCACGLSAAKQRASPFTILNAAHQLGAALGSLRQGGQACPAHAAYLRPSSELRLSQSSMPHISSARLSGESPPCANSRLTSTRRSNISCNMRKRSRCASNSSD